jgi:hypothetical protein
MGYASPIAKRSGEVREALGREGEKFNLDKALRVAAEIPERFANVANRSGRIPQALVSSHPLAAFGSDSRSESFFG